MRLPALLSLVVSFALLPLRAQDGSTPIPAGTQSKGSEPKAATQDPAAPPTAPTLFEAFAGYQPQKGLVPIGDQARVILADGWIWLGDSHARRFLVQLGNPEDDSVLGVAIPPDFETSNAFAVYSYADEGYVADDEDPDFDDLLSQMKDRAAEESEARKQAGLPTVKLVGWAEPPHYDRTQHKLYWAERLKFGDSETDTLNYNVRILGRGGYLVVQGVGDIAHLNTVAEHCKTLLVATEFVEGKRYENFDPSYDKVAAYGIGGLVAGKLALKAGLFAKLLLMLKAFAKPILIGVVAIGAIVVKTLGGKRAAAATEARTAQRNRRTE